MKRISWLISICIISCIYDNTYAQTEQSVIDSLLKELPNVEKDTDKVNLLYNLSDALSESNPDEGIEYGQQGLEICKKMNWKLMQAKIYHAIGLNHLYKSDYNKALEYYTETLKLYEELGDKRNIAGGYNNIGNVYHRQSNDKKALEYYIMALNLAEEAGIKQFAANITANMGNIYSNLKDHEKALECFIKSASYFEEMGDQYSIAGITGAIGAVYLKLGDYSKAQEYLSQALELSENGGYKLTARFAALDMGSTYQSMKKYTMAAKYFQMSLRLAEDLGDESGKAETLSNIAGLYIEIVRHTGSTKNQDGESVDDGFIPKGRNALLSATISNLQNSLAIAKEIQAFNIMLRCYDLMIDAYRLSGDYRKAMEASDNYHAIKDSIFSQENKEEILKMAMKNEYDRQRLADSLQNVEAKKIAAIKLQRQKTFTYSGIGVALVLSVLAFSIAKERKKSDKLLLNILPSEVATELKKKGESDAQMFDNVTVLFTDFVGFTKVSERLSPQELVHELHECFKAFDEIMGRYSMEKIKTIGDAYLAVCGLPTADEQHAEKVINAAIEIKNFMVDRHQHFGDRTFEMRIGVHTGPVVAGIVGVKKFAYDIWGDTVNTASRMESSGEPGKINISQTTYELVQDKFTCTYRGELEAKNKGKLRMYFVEA